VIVFIHPTLATLSVCPLRLQGIELHATQVLVGFRPARNNQIMAVVQSSRQLGDELMPFWL
jgi:hypothetical protein